MEKSGQSEAMMPPPEIKTFSLLSASISSRVKGNPGLPDGFVIGSTGVADSCPGRSTVGFEDLKADMIWYLWMQTETSERKRVMIAGQ